MEKKMETLGSFKGLYRGYRVYIWLSWDNGKETGNYCGMLVLYRLGFWVKLCRKLCWFELSTWRVQCALMCQGFPTPCEP